jgi:hypothetical protein
VRRGPLDGADYASLGRFAPVKRLLVDRRVSTGIARQRPVEPRHSPSPAWAADAPSRRVSSMSVEPIAQLHGALRHARASNLLAHYTPSPALKVLVHALAAQAARELFAQARGEALSTTPIAEERSHAA